MTNLVKREIGNGLPAGLAHFESYEAWQVELMAWVNTLKAPPDQAKGEVKTNEFADGALYVPIGVVQEKLDYFYGGMWQTVNFRWQVVANEMVGAIDLLVFHPKALTWVTHTGAAAVQIQLTKGAEVLDISKKIKNTLTKDFPHLKAECEKSAAKELGNTFGRNLNRKGPDVMAEVMTPEDAEIQIKSTSTREELWALYNKFGQSMKSDKRIIKHLREHELFLKSNR